MQPFKIFAFLSFSLAIAWGQSGTVKSEGQPIPGATVRATQVLRQDIGSLRRDGQGDRALITVTDANGTFTLDKMTPGTWTVDVNMFGFEASQRETLHQLGNAQVAANVVTQPFQGDFHGVGEA